MADFKKAVLTARGNALLVDAAAGKKIVFTKMATGNGMYDGTENLSEATALKGQRQSFPLLAYEKVSADSILLKAVATNEGLAMGYRMTEVGIYGKLEGGEEELCSIATTAGTENADLFPPYNGMAPTEIVISYYVTISPDAAPAIRPGSGDSLAEVMMEATRAAGDAARAADAAAGTAERAAEQARAAAEKVAGIHVATDETAGIVKGNPDDITIGMDGAMSILTTFTEQRELTELDGTEDKKNFFGKIAKAVSSLITHISSNDNPHRVTKSDVGLGNVENTADAKKNVLSAMMLKQQQVTVPGRDMDDYRTPGLYYFGSSYKPVSTPSGYHGWLAVINNGSTDFCRQIWMSMYVANGAVAKDLYTRGYGDGAWSEWTKYVNWDDINVALADTTDGDYSLICADTKAHWLKSIRTQANAPEWIINSYSSGIAFGGSDTKAVISVRQNNPQVRFSGANITHNTSWWFGLKGKTGKEYDLESMDGRDSVTLVNDFLTTLPGQGALDAAVGKTLKDMIDEQSKKLDFAYDAMKVVYANHNSGSFTDNLAKYGMDGTKTIDDLINILPENKINVAHLWVHTNSTSNNFSASLPAATGGDIIIYYWFLRGFILFFDRLGNRLYFSTINDGAIVGWKQVSVVGGNVTSRCGQFFAKNLGTYIYNIGEVRWQYAGTNEDGDKIVNVSVDGCQMQTPAADDTRINWLNADVILQAAFAALECSRIVGSLYGSFRYFPGYFASELLTGYAPLILYSDQYGIYLGRIYEESGSFGGWALSVIPAGNYGFDMTFILR